MSQLKYGVLQIKIYTLEKSRVLIDWLMEIHSFVKGILEFGKLLLTETLFGNMKVKESPGELMVMN
jgi:hypothetical protein